MAVKKFEGVFLAMPTPLLKNEDIDVDSLCRLIDYSIGEGANGMMFAGTMGEGNALVDSQKKVLIETAVKHIAGRVPVLATVCEISTRRTIDLAKSMDGLGADYLVCLAPSYYKYPDPQSIIDHVKAVAGSVSTPVIFYNAPGGTGNPVSPDTLDEILNMRNIAGIKDSSGDYRNFVELLRRYPDKNDRPGTIMQGDEFVFASSVLMGVDGIISGGGTAYIKTLVNLFEAGVKGDRINAIKFQRQYKKELLDMIGSNFGRDWMYKIKDKLVSRGVISNAYVTKPFLES